MFSRKKGSTESESAAKALGLRFRNGELFRQALTHPSYVNESSGRELDNNQRLEYLGDSVLGLVVNEHLYLENQELPEGPLARMKSRIVSEESLAKAARRIKLGNYLYLGRGERSTGGDNRPSNLADALEALIAAVYLDQGYGEARNFVLRVMKPIIESVSGPAGVGDHKSRFQELSQKEFKARPEYAVLEEKGPGHRKEFLVGVYLNEVEVGRGRGTSRKRAEQVAARDALEKIADPAKKPP